MERGHASNTDPIWNRLRVAGWGIAAVLLLLPAVAMQFSSGVSWTGSDFVFAAVMLGGTGLICEIVLRRSKSNFYRIGAVVALAAAFLIVWVSGAVGIIGNESHPANLMYIGVLGTALFGALASRFRAGGLSVTMFATAVVQAVVTVVAIVATMGTPAGRPVEIVVFNGFFILLWLFSAGLFRNASSQDT